MAKKQSATLSTTGTRDFTLTLETVIGAITLFYAFIDGIKVIQADGTKKRTWSGKIPEAQIRIKIRVVGIDSASFKLGIDLPGTANDQSLTFILHDGYFETEIHI